MNFIKKLSVVPFVIMAASCASKTGFEPYSVQSEVQKQKGAGYQLSSVALVLSGADASERYPNEDALQSDLQGYLNEEIKERGVNGDVYDLRISVQWERRMIGKKDEEKDVFSSAGCLFESTISLDGKNIATDKGDPLNADSIASGNKNFLNNLRRIGDSLARSGDPESEQRELKRCAKLIAERLPK